MTGRVTFITDIQTLQRFPGPLCRDLHKDSQKDVVFCLLARRHDKDLSGDRVRQPTSAETSFFGNERWAGVYFGAAYTSGPLYSSNSR